MVMPVICEAPDEYCTQADASDDVAVCERTARPGLVLGAASAPPRRQTMQTGAVRAKEDVRSDLTVALVREAKESKGCRLMNECEMLTGGKVAKDVGVTVRNLLTFGVQLAVEVNPVGCN